VPLSLDPARIRSILLDIEGTTTSIEFVYQTLFPYAREHVAEFLRNNSDSEPVQEAVRQVRREWEADTREHSDSPAWRAGSHADEIESAAAYCRWLIDRDRKSTALKSLQGMIWESGYQSGELRGHVYPDVPAAFARWTRQGKALSIFSSGSVLAQKLIFAHTQHGDLTPFITSYFDTTTGPKKAPESYHEIADALGLPSDAILFLSDSVAELDAARTAGMETALSARPENPPAGAHEHAALRSFDDVLP
jgi:enolase-phosphatase E1